MPGCIFVGVMGLVVEIPLYTAIAIVKSPYMLFKGWHRLIHDLISREGPFLETACIPVAGLTILMWPLFVIGSIIMAIFSSFFIGLYGSVIVYQVHSFVPIKKCVRWCMFSITSKLNLSINLDITAGEVSQKRSCLCDCDGCGI